MLTSFRRRSRVQTVAALASIALLPCAVRAGDLNPPPGPVERTMKTLDEVSPWTPLDPATAPGAQDAVVAISQSGRYRLTGHVVGQSGKHGIKITAPSVVLDLAGFNLQGVPGSLNGVHAGGGLAFECIEIAHEGLKMQGVIRDFGGDGIHVENAQRLSISGVSVASCGGDGIRGSGITFGYIIWTNAQNCAGDGVHLENSDGATIAVDNVSGNGGDGIEARVLNWVAVRSSIQDFEKNTENVSGGFGLISSNGGHGVFVEQVGRATFSDLRIEDSANDGIHAASPGLLLPRRLEIARVDIDTAGGHGVRGHGWHECFLTNYAAAGCGGDGMNLTPAAGGSVNVGDNDNWTFGGSTIKGCAGSGIVVSGGSLIHFTGLEIQSVGLRAIDVSTAIADRAEVRVEKFNIRQEFGPTQAGVRIDGPASIQLSDGSIRDCGTNALFCVQFKESDFDFLSISSTGLDGIVLRPGDTSAPTEATQTVLKRVSCFGSLGDNVQFNPLATAGTHRLSISDGQFNNSAGRGISVVPQTAGVYVFELVVTDSTTSGNALDGIAFDPAPGVRADSCNVTLSGVQSTGNGGDGARFTWTQVGGPFKFTARDGNLSHNGGHGGYVYWTTSTIRGMSFDGNGIDGFYCENSVCTIEDSQANGNTGNGFHAVSSFGVAGQSFVLDGSRSHDDGLVGVFIDGAPPVIVNCSISGNVGGGIDISNVSGASVSQCSIGHNGGLGIWSRSSVSSSSFVGNQCDNNGGAIQVDGTGNFVARNSATVGALGGISVAQGNLVGPLVDSSNIATECSPNSNMIR